MWKCLLLTLAFSAHLYANGISRDASCDELIQDAWLGRVVAQNINKQLEAFSGNWALASQQIMFALIIHFQNPNLDFAYFERFFRKHNWPLFLVANSLPLEPGLAIGYPPELKTLKGNAEPKYHLWVGVNGKTEADELKRHLGITDEENLIRLRETGFIVADDLESQRDNSAVKFADSETLDKLKKVTVKNSADAQEE